MLDLIIKNGQCHIDNKLINKDLGIKEGKIVEIGSIKEESIETFDAVNFTIRKQEDQMRTMKCIKRGLAGVHVKNVVQDDRVTTIPHKKHQMDF